MRIIATLLAVSLLGCASGFSSPGGWTANIAVGDAQFSTCPEKQTSESGVTLQQEQKPCVVNTASPSEPFTAIATGLFQAALALLGRSIPGVN